VHILMISDVYFPRINGVSTSIHSFRSGLIAEGHRVTLICPAYPEAQTLERANDNQDDDDIIRIRARSVILDPEDRMMNYREVIQLIPRLEPLGLDLVHIHTPFVAHYAGLKIAHELDIPVTESYHTFFEEYLYNYIKWLPKPWLKFMARRFSKSQCNSVDALIVPSSPMRDALSEYGITTPMHILPTGLDLDQFRTPPVTDFRAHLGVSPESPLLLYVGRVALEKNIDFLIDMIPSVLARHPEAILVIAGEGPAEHHLRRRVRSMALEKSILFVGYMRRDGSLQDAYRAADLFVFASRTETQGLVLLEALALGTPVVALGAMGTLDVLNSEGGCLIAPDHPGGFASVINATLDTPQRIEQLAQQATRYAATWSADQKTALLVDRYIDLVTEKRQSSC
jgi:1,2-diacylglycerol 3-alpha-glucosyltransferase